MQGRVYWAINSSTIYEMTSGDYEDASSFDVEATQGDLIVGMIQCEGNANSFSLNSNYTVVQEASTDYDTSPSTRRCCVFYFRAPTTGTITADITINGSLYVALWSIPDITAISATTKINYTMANNMKSFSFARQNNNLNLWMIGVNASNDGQLSTNITTEGIVSYTKLVSFLESDKTANTITVNSVNSSTFYSSAMPDIVCLALTRKGYSIEPTTLTNIGNAIRTKLNGNTKYKPSQMPNAILSIPSAQIDYPATSSRKYWFYQGHNLSNQPLWDIVKNTAPYSSDANAYMFDQSITDATKDQLYQAQNWKIDQISEEMFRNCTYLSDFQLSDDFYTRYHLMSCTTFYNCYMLSIEKATNLFANLLSQEKMTGSPSWYSGFYNIGRDLTTGADLGDLTIAYDKIDSFSSYLFTGCNIKKIGTLTLRNTGTGTTTLAPYSGTWITSAGAKVGIEEIGKIVFDGVKWAVTGSASLLGGVMNSLKKFGGIELDTTAQGNTLMNNSANVLALGNKSIIEECLNIPISYMKKGFGNVFFNNQGTSSNLAPLHRLTCNTTNTPYLDKTTDKSFSIKYSSFNRAEMVEMFNSLPDASDVTGAKNITITGNPCVTDGTLTAADMAIATNKGYTLTT